MPTVFTMIIDRQIPGRFVYEDDVCAAFLTIEPLATGHTLIVPRQEVDDWLDLDVGTLDHLMAVAQRVGNAIRQVYKPTKVGMMIAGLEVPHVHIHVSQLNNVHDLDFARADRDPDPDELDRAAVAIRDALTRVP
jgi:histidine triad (HIT) family protein